MKDERIARITLEPDKFRLHGVVDAARPSPVHGSQPRTARLIHPTDIQSSKPLGYTIGA
jgi:hypothetical protein